MRASFTGAMVAAFVWLAPSANAARCDVSRPSVQLQFAAKFGEAFESAVLAELRAMFVRYGISACGERGELQPPPADALPIATVTVRANGDDAQLVTIEVRDALTQKRVSRELPLRSLPADGRDLGLAVAIDELLRSSWVELELAHARARAPRPEQVAAVRVVRRAVRASLPAMEPPRVPRLWLGARAAIESYRFADRFVGADLAASAPLSRYFALEFELGARAAAERASSDGSVVGRAFQGAMSVAWNGGTALAPLLRAGFRLGHVTFEGRPADGVQGTVHSGVAIGARVDAGLRWQLHARWELRGLLAVGVPLRAVTAFDQQGQVAGQRGLELGGTVGVSVGF